MKNNHSRERIIDKALELFNEKGVEYIGMRELAASLDMHLGNITYYFPTKDDLVNEISILYSTGNEKIIMKVEGISPKEFLEMMEKAFHHQLRYQCIPLSMTHLLEQNPLIAARYKIIYKERVSALSFNLSEMMKGKFIQPLTETELAYLSASLSLIARFWISEARISQRHIGVQRKISYYIEMIGRMLLRYVTAKGKKDILGGWPEW